jgi:hypothetical protein
MLPQQRTFFADYKEQGPSWITMASGQFYPDILADACELYKPVLILFGQLLATSESSIRLFMQINEVPGPMRTQLTRVFRKYVSPATPVEMLKRKNKAEAFCAEFGHRFRLIHEVQQAFTSRPLPDEALCALLWEYHDRGKKGYDLTESFFGLFQSQLPMLSLRGPRAAGRDIMLRDIFPDYPNPGRTADFIVYDDNGTDVLAVGLARYDSDRGGAQEDDRIGGYLECADEVVAYAQRYYLRTKVIFVNDGPGLLLGSMWDDYSRIERRHIGRILVVTLRMIPERLTLDWLRS